MSHTVTVTRTTTTSTTSAILLNVGYFKSIPGILKLLHIILGVVCVAIVGHLIGSTGYPRDSSLFTPELFFLLIATTCLITSTLLLFSCLISIATATILPKTVLEIIYHFVATILIMVASIIYIIRVERVYTSSRQLYLPYYRESLSAGELTVYPPLTLLYVVASINLLCAVAYRQKLFTSGLHGYGTLIFGSIVGLINALLYGAATFFAYRSFKSG